LTTNGKDRTIPRSSLFRRTERGIPEVETQKPDGRRRAKRERIKATFYLEAEDVLAIDSLQMEAFRATGKKPERSELVSRAIQAYIKSQ
jgi:hypothetical protein